jgi:uncharacterized protein YecE (DUF72 family)
VHGRKREAIPATASRAPVRSVHWRRHVGRKPVVIRVGPAGWSYKDWAGTVYPVPRPRGFDPLAYLASYFDTIEINSTFYHPAPRSSADDWIRRVAGYADFRFTAKLWTRFTHERDTAFSRDDVATVDEAMHPLLEEGRLGALLLQFPWSFRRTDENRQWLDDVTRAFRRYPLVLEVRHESWNVPGFYEELADRKIGFVNIDQPRFRDSITPSATATSGVGYVRLHGRNYEDWFREGAGVEARYDYLYSPDELDPWVDRAKDVASATIETFIITNNHFQGKAIANAVMIESKLAGRAVPAPPPVIAAYAPQLEGFAQA